MNNEPKIDILPYKHRSRFFWMLVLVFAIALPALIFYTTGNRISFENEETTIVTTGGIYVTTDKLDVDVYLDEEQVDRPRLFRSAYYIQNIQVGQHRIVVQRPDLQTWVKDLPVDSYIVTEVSAFNMPVMPHLRPITRYTTEAGVPVYRGVTATSSELLFTKATSTVAFETATSTATSTLLLNEEFTYVASLFGTSSTSSVSVFERILDQVDRFRFSSSTDESETASTTATTTEKRIIRGEMELLERERELFARWLGSSKSIPYYFCITSSSATSTSQRYGEHVTQAFAAARFSTSSPLIIEANRECRTEIKLDRLRQDVFYYSFFPNSSDLVLLQLEDGIYVTELDDRAWQNSQLLYPGTDLQVIVENNQIYLKEGDYYYEIVTEIEPI